MNITTSFENIRNVYKQITAKADADVILIYKGTSHGVTKPWKAQIEAREYIHENCEGAITGLLNMLKQDLSNKIKSAENELERLRKFSSTLDN